MRTYGDKTSDAFRKAAAAVASLGLFSAVVALAAGATPGYAEPDALDQLNSWHYPYSDGWRDYEGGEQGWTIRTGATYYAVDDDEGRFREDRFIGDDLTGGIEELSYSKDHLSVSVRAIFEDLYGADFHYVKPEQFRVDFTFNRHRRYYDGSNEAWDPTLYGLPADFADFDDDDLFADRVDLNLEGTLLVPDLPQVTVGWHHWERTGDEVLLRGARARVTGDPVPRFRGIPALSDLDGKSDTIYVEVPFTLADKYNFKFRQEYEHYRDDQLIVFPRYRDGAVEQFRTFDDEPEWKEWRSLAHFDSFITDGYYVSVNWYHSDLENSSDRDVIRPGSTNKLVGTNVDNDRTTDVFTVGMAFLNLVEDGTLQTALRIEHADTDSSSLGFQANGTPHRQDTGQEETRIGESARFVWKGLPNTTLALDGEWEQRYLEDDQLADVSDHELNTDFTPADTLLLLDRNADINHLDQEYTITVVNRPRSAVRLTGRYRFSDRERDYDENVDDEIYAVAGTPPMGFYPGVLGDMEQQTHELSGKIAYRFLPAWTATVSSEYEQSEIEYDVQGTEGQEIDIYRVSGTIFGSPCAKLTLTAMGRYESFELDTPTVAPAGSNWQDGSSAYDEEYDSFILFGSANYVLNEKWSANCAYQHTENNGGQNNSLDEIWLGADYMLAEGKIIKARYEYFNFDDDLGDGFDDYDGHGIYVALAYRF